MQKQAWEYYKTLLKILSSVVKKYQLFLPEFESSTLKNKKNKGFQSHGISNVALPFL
jgi:hypothetical protein